MHRLVLCLHVSLSPRRVCCYFAWCLSVADCSSWTLSSSVFSTTVQTVVQHKTASPVPSSWTTSPRWAWFPTTSTVSKTVFTPFVAAIAGDARAGRRSRPPGWPSLLGGIPAQAREEASGGGSQHAVIRRKGQARSKKHFRTWTRCRKVFCHCAFDFFRWWGRPFSLCCSAVWVRPTRHRCAKLGSTCTASWWRRWVEGGPRTERTRPTEDRLLSNHQHGCHGVRLCNCSTVALAAVRLLWELGCLIATVWYSYTLNADRLIAEFIFFTVDV